MNQQIILILIVLLIMAFVSIFIPKKKNKVKTLSVKENKKSKIKNVFGLEEKNPPIPYSKKERKREKVKQAVHGLRCYARGLTRGEHLVVDYLSEKLSTRKYYIFNNLTLKTEDGSTQIDHVIVSLYGIFVIETKDCTGWIFGDEKGKVWTQLLPGNNKYTFQNPYRQNFKHIKTLESYLPFIPNRSYKTIIITH